MLNFRTIRSQVYFGVGVLSVIVLILSAVSLQGVMKFRKLTKNIRARSVELPLAADLSEHVSELRSYVWKIDREKVSLFGLNSVDFDINVSGMHRRLEQLQDSLDRYRNQLENNEIEDPRFADKSREFQFVAEFQNSLNEIRCLVEEDCWSQSSEPFTMLNGMKENLEQLQSHTAQLPVFMQVRTHNFAENAKAEYRTWITLSVLFSVAAFGMIVMLANRFRNGLLLPMDKLIEGSRHVAAGNHDFRIQLDSDDEVAELGNALNAMTNNFQEIKADLNNQVQLRTKEVVRSEKMASVGFLAAGVAHEINNPLASIAWSAESLEMRLQEILNPDPDTDEETRNTDIEEMKNYLARIQEEAFRCKEITSGLLDFSRMGDVQKVPTNLSEVIASVVDIVKPLSRYRDRNIHLDTDPSVCATVNAQEIKQVALNLITNALGSVEAGGTVSISVESENENAVMRVVDNGCGLTDDVKEHLFEPFFTRRRDGQGTGLGLSITYQIVEDHQGKITAESDGPGTGSTFTITLPLVNQLEKVTRYAA
ncbi:sensor histidine kinase [Mariniblastus fucicola]|uniref:sensor histidine kinase n=1 Tax=Mariniblastus fucicola TaxID=980251 RepID=UPI0011DF5F9F|nr:HAMP domain-containing sensor histidine kinase [Mariniblastus fucicola]